MAKYAVMKFSSIEYRYQKEYGIMPDYDFTNMLKAGYTVDQASQIRQERIEKLWADMLAEHEREERLKPFLSINKGDHFPF